MIIGAVFATNLIWLCYQTCKSAGKPKLLLFNSFSLLFVLLPSFAIYNYNELSILIKSFLTSEQIDLVRKIAATLTDGGSMLLFLESFTGQAFVVLGAIGTLCGIAIISMVFRVRKQYKKIKKQSSYNNNYFSKYYTYNTSFLARSNQ